MPFSIADLIKQADRPSTPLPPQVLVYGAGNKGHQICSELCKRGVEVIAVLDARATAGQTCNGIAVLTPAMWLSNHDAASMTIIVAIHNEHTFLPPIMDGLRSMGFAHILSPIALYDTLPDLPAHYWLVPRRFYQPFAAELTRLEALLADQASRDCLASVLKLRIGGDYAALPEPGLLDQYHPANLPRWPQQLRFVDGGAYTGDTLQQLAADGYAFDAIAAFEPDLDNYRKLVRNSERFDDAICLPCGLAECSKRIGFTSGMGGGSHIDSAGGEQITCVALDEALPDFRPNLIKLDVEGAEPDALQGAARTIALHRPALAISLYHHPEHLWRIPFLIDGWKLGYSFHLRCHAQSSFDLVLYALPQ